MVNRENAWRRHTRSAVSSAAPPTAQNGRALSSAALRVSVPRAVKRPTRREPQGRASITETRNRSGHTSRPKRSSAKEAVPPSSTTAVRQSWCSPKASAGAHAEGRSKPAIVNKETPGITPGATPTRASVAICTPKVTRVRSAAPGDAGTGISVALGASAVGADGVLFDVDVPSPAVLSMAEPPAAAGVPASSVLAFKLLVADDGSRVTAMIRATASTASAQLRAGTWRTDGLVPGLTSVTSPVTTPDGAVEILARIDSPLPSSTSRTRGKRARTRSIRAARVVQVGSASTSRFVDAIARLGSAAAWRSPAPYPTAAISSDSRRAVILVSARGSIAR